MKLANCQLAFLSACETALNKNMLLRDKGLHVTGAFNITGVPHAVASIWKIMDITFIKPQYNTRQTVFLGAPLSQVTFHAYLNILYFKMLE